MIVTSDNNHYGVPKDLFFSFPVIIKDNDWRIVKGFKFNKYFKN